MRWPHTILLLTALIAVLAGQPGLSVAVSATQTSVYLPLVVVPRENCSAHDVPVVTPAPSTERIAFILRPDFITIQAYRLIVQHLDGSGWTELMRTNARLTKLSWAPDGDRLAVASDDNTTTTIQIFRLSDHTLTTIIRRTRPQLVLSPAWSPDGSQIAFVQSNGAGGDIFVMRPDGSQIRRLTSTVNNGDPAWSPDSRQIVFSSGRTGIAQLYTMQADGTRQTQLTYRSTDSFEPAWSPDGTRIAFVSFCEGYAPTIPSLFVMRADGSGIAQLPTPLATGQYSPAWSPDSTRVVYIQAQYKVSPAVVLNVDGSGRSGIGGAEMEVAVWAPR